MDAGRWGIAEGYHDVAGEWHPTPESTARAFLEAMGADTETPPEAPVRVVTAGEHVPLDRAAELETEDGATVRVEGAMPPDVPLGYHRLTGLDAGRAVRLIVTPPRCHLP